MGYYSEVKNRIYSKQQSKFADGNVLPYTEGVVSFAFPISKDAFFFIKLSFLRQRRPLVLHFNHKRPNDQLHVANRIL